MRREGELSHRAVSSKFLPDNRLSWHHVSMKTSKTLTVKEAAQLAGKSEKTIRRWLGEITSTVGHELRSKIEPGISEEQAMRANRERVIWQIDEQIIREKFLNGVRKKAAQTAKAKSSAGESETEFLRRQLEEVQAELATEREHNRMMQTENNERQAEWNKTIQGIQFQLLTQKQKSEEGSGVINVDARPDSDTPSTEAANVEGSEEPTENAVEVGNQESVRKRLLRWTKYGPAVRFDRDQSAIKFYVARGE